MPVRDLFAIAYQTALDETVERFSAADGFLALQVGGYKHSLFENNQWRPDTESKNEDNTDNPADDEDSPQDTGKKGSGSGTTGYAEAMGAYIDMMYDIADSSSTAETGQPPGQTGNGGSTEGDGNTGSNNENNAQNVTKEPRQEDESRQEGSILDPLDITTIPIVTFEPEPILPLEYHEPLGELMHAFGNLVYPIADPRDETVKLFNCDNRSYAIDTEYFPPRYFIYNIAVDVQEVTGHRLVPLRPRDLARGDYNEKWTEIHASNIPCGIAGMDRYWKPPVWTEGQPDPTE